MILHPHISKISKYLDGILSDKKRNRFEMHISKCETCSKKVQLLDTVSRFCRLPKGKLESVSKNVMGRIDKRKWHTSSPLIGEIQSVVGIVIIKRNSQEERIQAFPGLSVRRGDHLVTIGDSKALVELTDRSHLYVNKESKLDFTAGQYNLSMWAGEIFAMMKPQKKAFEIKTPSAVLGVIGTDFDAQITKKKETILKVLKGKVAFKNDSGDVLVKRKRQVEASKYTRPTPTKIKHVKSTASWAKPLSPTMKRGGSVMRKVLVIVGVMAVVLAAWLLMQKSKRQEVTVTVSGKVIDAETSQPIPKAMVRGHVVVWLHQGPDLFDKCPYQEMKTGVDGAYRFTFVTPLTQSGTLKRRDGICVYASASGYETKPVYVKPYVTIHNTDFPNADIELGPGKLVKGKVVDYNNKPIEGAVVRVRNGLNGDWNFFGALGKTYTNENGEFEVWCRKEDKDGGEIIGTDPWVHIFKQGYGIGHFFDILKKEDMGTLVIPRGGTITGRVTNAKGKGIANCEVCVRSWSGRDEYDRTRTDAEGKYMLKGVPGGAALNEFYKRKNPGATEWPWLAKASSVDVYARLDPKKNLEECPHYQITAKEGETLTASDLVIRK